MASPGKQRDFEILREVLALAEERRWVALADAAAIVGVTVERLRALLEPVLFLEFRIGGELIGQERAFLLNERDELTVDEHHWLRDLCADPPSPDAALRLLIAGLEMQALTMVPTPDLDHAVAKLRDVVAAELRMQVETPTCLAVVQKAHREGRSVRFRYLKDGASKPADREVFPDRVFAKWGHWYVTGREVDGGDPKHFRIDRMVSAEIGDLQFDPPPHVDVPDWFDLHQLERTVRVRLRRSSLASLRQPLRVKEIQDLGDGRVEVELTVTGDRRLEHLLVCLDPDTEIVAPSEMRDLQRQTARRLLASNESS